MKLVNYKKKGRGQLAILINDWLYDVNSLVKAAPNNMKAMLEEWETYYPLLFEQEAAIQLKLDDKIGHVRYKTAELLAPVPYPTSCRDGYAFRQHVETARRNRNVPMIPQFDQYPVFYFTNHNSIKGPGKIHCMPDHFHKLDFELEAAIVICKHGTNIKAEDADEYIGGLMIMNDWSARTLQMEEMLLNLGPAKGKDFATSIGPWLVTLDELREFETAPKQNHIGKSWNLKMKCRVNGVLVSEGNLDDMDWTFAEIIEMASYGVDLYPGDIIGSGTVGTGCFLELNGTGRLQDAGYKEQWLQHGDIVELEIDHLGTLTNTIAAVETNHSILNSKEKIGIA